MGDRVLIRFCDARSASPTIYGHWSGESALPMLAAFFKSSCFTKRPGDVSYNAARFIGMMHDDIGGTDGDGHSLGLWDEEDGADAWLADREHSHGDAGLVLVDYRENAVRVAHGYLTDSNRDTEEVAKARAELATLGFPVVVGMAKRPADIAAK